MDFKIPNLVNKVYSWQGGAFRFDSPDEVTTTWGKGMCVWISDESVEISWLGYFHLIKFSDNYNSYTSIRKGDLEKVSGKLLL